MRTVLRHWIFVSLASVAACAGSAYLPGKPGGARSDVSGPDVRDAWIAAHPETDAAIAEAIREAVFVPGMTLEHRDVITNPERKGTTGNGFWRSRVTGDEVRYQWYVAAERQPFVDGRERLVCELVYSDGALRAVRFCAAESGPAEDPT